MSDGVQMRIDAKESLAAAKEKIANARLLVKNNIGVMRQVSVYLDQWVQRNFKEDGGKVGGWSWYKYGGRLTTKKKANAQSIDGRRYINSTAKLLRDSGHLRLSFLPAAKLDSALIGSELPYSKHHEEGTQRLPQRRMLPQEADVKDDVREIFEDWIVVQLGKVVG